MLLGCVATTPRTPLVGHPHRLTKKALLALYEAVTTHRDMAPEDAMAQAGAVSDAMVEAFRATLTASNLDPAFR